MERRSKNETDERTGMAVRIPPEEILVTLHELSKEVDVVLIVSAVALGLAVPLTIMCFSLLHKVTKLEGRDGGRLRLDGNALHGRIVYVDHFDWEREIARWGLDSNGYMVFDQNSDHTLYTGYMIAGPSDIDPAIRTGPEAPYRHKAKKAQSV